MIFKGLASPFNLYKRKLVYSIFMNCHPIYMYINIHYLYIITLRVQHYLPKMDLQSIIHGYSSQNFIPVPSKGFNQYSEYLYTFSGEEVKKIHKNIYIYTNVCTCKLNDSRKSWIKTVYLILIFTK